MDGSESAEPMKVPEDPMIIGRKLTSRAGVLEQQEPDLDLAIYRQVTTFGGFVHF